MVSYNKEQAVGDDQCNVLTIAMHQFDFDVNEAMSWASERHFSLQNEFLALMKVVPRFSPEVNKELDEYITGVANWARATACWNFECKRYFGEMGLKVMQTREVPMLAKVGAGILH